MNKSYYSLGLMSGTSGDGIDVSIIRSDGEYQYETVLDRYFEYNAEIIENIHKLKDKIGNNSEKLNKFQKELSILEEKITLFHADAVNNILNTSKQNVDFIGFHGQTILHSPSNGITKQLGDGKLLSKITKRTVIYNFRKNDLINGGEGAPLAPIFHKMLAKKYKLNLPLSILNIGGIANVTNIDIKSCIYSKDIGPGNCLIDEWIRKKTKKKYDISGKIAKSGEINKTILNKALKNFIYKNTTQSFDVKDFNGSFVNDLSLEDGAATLTEFTSEILKKNIQTFFGDIKFNILMTGGGRKNNFLVKTIKEKFKIPIKLIDDFGINGDFVESQAFAYLAIRSYLKLPISFPETTGCKKPCTGGILIKNY